MILISILSISCIYASNIDDSLSINNLDDSSSLISNIDDSSLSIANGDNIDLSIANNDNPESNQIIGDGISDFDDLSNKINNAPEGSLLELDRDYTFQNSSNVQKGILISKSITIDGKGHTINANKVARVFNITADNVVLMNINFINGNALGRYDRLDAGGGAIYWYGNHGTLLNCNFSNNSGYGIEDDPFDNEEEIVDENGNVIHRIIIRPIGAKVNEGGAIVWKGNYGTVSNCIFTNNTVGYPNSGGAIEWKGNNGQVLNSTFYRNGAWCGGAISWSGNNGKILSSAFFDNGYFSGDIYWFGKNGLIKNSILLKSNSNMPVVVAYSGSLDANYNFWGDTFSNPNGTVKIKNLKNWYILNTNATKPKLYSGNKLLVGFDDFLLVTKYGNVYDKDGKKIAKLNLNPIGRIISKNLKKYYKSSKQFKVKVYGPYGKLAKNKYVTFKINKKTYKVKTNKKGIAVLKINLKPGNYTVLVKYGKAQAKFNITVKNLLITKDITKKLGKRKYFPIKVVSKKGNPLAKQTVKIKFRGKTYKLKTNKYGKGRFILSKRLKAGKYKIKVKYKDITNINKITVKK